MKKNPSSILSRLQGRRDANAFRSLDDFSDQTDFFSNDYLGLARLEDNNSHKAGSTGSRLISGNSKRTEQIEAELAEFYRQDAAIFFNSGYDANVGLFSSVPQRGDTIIYDELIHASIRDGIKMGNASSFSFKHNDLDQLKEKMSRAEGEKYVAVEAVYSMDGDEAPLKAIAAICEEVGAYLIVDEAHSGGFIGPQGRGLVCNQDLDTKIFAKTITFGKAYGSHGAIVMGSNELRDYLINFARSLIYTTALSPYSQERIVQVVAQSRDMDVEREQLKSNIEFFKKQFTSSKYQLISSESPIQCVIVPGNDEVKIMAKLLGDNGLAVKAILHPTVQAGSERLRFCIHSYNTEEEILKLTQLING